MTDIDTVDIDTVDIDTVDIDTVEQRLEQARHHVTAAERFVTARAPRLAELHAAVDGAIHVNTALAELIATVMRQAPATLDHTHQAVLHEVLADLRAMHGCLTTGPLLLAPARDALHLLVTNRQAGPAMLDAPAPDRADHQRPGRPFDAVEVLHGAGDVLEADPADVADQRRDAPLVDEGEPWH